MNILSNILSDKLKVGDVPFSFELDSSASSKFFHGFILAFSSSNSSIDNSSASPIALWIRAILEGGTPLRSNSELDFP
jgi:hypothetical protein